MHDFLPFLRRTSGIHAGSRCQGCARTGEEGLAFFCFARVSRLRTIAKACPRPRFCSTRQVRISNGRPFPSSGFALTKAPSMPTVRLLAGSAIGLGQSTSLTNSCSILLPITTVRLRVVTADNPPVVGKTFRNSAAARAYDSSAANSACKWAQLGQNAVGQ